MRSIFALFFTIIATLTNLVAQSSIEGIVVENTSKQKLEFASVTLSRLKDSTIATGVVSNAEGRFLLKDVKPGSYFITISFLGYASKSIDKLVITSENRVNLGEIGLEYNEKLLKEVIISGEQTNNLHKIDKQIYKASQFKSAVGGTAIDVLRNTPSVTLNAEGDITLRGASGFQILINGKPVQLDAKTILNQIPANSIENIEVITAPSAKYDPDGKAGIINIVTRKGTMDGLALTANVQGGLPSLYTYDNLKSPQRYGADATLNLRAGKWDITASGNYLRHDNSGERIGDVNTTVENVYTSFPSQGERSFIRKSYTATAFVTYHANKSTSISSGFYKGKRTQSRRADILYHNTKVDLNSGNTFADYTYFNSNVVSKTGEITLGNLDYSHTFENKSVLLLSGLYEHAGLTGEVTNLNQDYPETTTVFQYTFNPSRNPLDAYRLKGEYSINIDSSKLEVGYQFRHQKQEGDFKYLDKNLQTGQFIEYPAFTSKTQVNNLIHSIFAQFSGDKGRLKYVGGLRYEYASRDFKAKDLPIRTLNLSNLFPSVNLQFSISEHLKAKGSYSKRVQRSTNNELNPFPEREHSETLEQGDPDILPEFIDLAELGILKDFSRGNFFATLYHQHIKNVVNRVNSVYNDTILNRIYTNAGKANLWGLEAGVNFKPLRWWSIYTGANVYDYHIKGALFLNSVKVNSRSLIYSINANTNVQLTPSLSFQCNVNYLSERVTAQGKDSRFLIMNSSLRKTFLSGNLAATLQWQNMDLGLLGTNKQRITTWGRDFYTTTNYIQETDIFIINLSYNLNQLGKKLKLPKSEFGEKEL